MLTAWFQGGASGKGWGLSVVEPGGRSLDPALETGVWEPSLPFFSLLSDHEMSGLSHQVAREPKHRIHLILGASESEPTGNIIQEKEERT